MLAVSLVIFLISDKRPGARHYSVICLPTHLIYPFTLSHIWDSFLVDTADIYYAAPCRSHALEHEAYRCADQTHFPGCTLYELPHWILHSHHQAGTMIPSLRMRKLETEGRIHFPIYMKDEGGAKHEEGERLITPNQLPNIKEEKLGWQVNKWLFINIAILKVKMYFYCLQIKLKWTPTLNKAHD